MCVVCVKPLGVLHRVEVCFLLILLLGKALSQSRVFDVHTVWVVVCNQGNAFSFRCPATSHCTRTSVHPRIVYLELILYLEV